MERGHDASAVHPKGLDPWAPRNSPVRHIRSARRNGCMVRLRVAMPVLLRSREVPLQVVFAAVVPALVGGIAGWLLGLNEAAYVVWSVIALAGGYFAGL